MKTGLLLLLLAGLACDDVSGVVWHAAGNYARDFAGGASDMWRAYQDMRDANFVGADKYFHARGNYDAAQRGAGGRHAAAIISEAREMWQGQVSGRGADDTAADQHANRWGRSGNDPNHFRPKHLDPKY